MKLSKMALVAALACAMHGGSVFGQELTSNNVALASCCESTDCDDCGCNGGCDGCCGDNGCDSMFGLGSLGLGDCCIGDPYEVFGSYNGWHVGGWGQIGYHTQDSQNRFNDDADGIRLHQAWLYAEKVADGSCGFDIGGRIDAMYGIDGPDTQAFGPNDDSWDQDWDNGGSYGWAIPQLYVEAAYGDLSVKAGHFYTPIGYETVTPVGNFFYSHAYTMYNNEPFTHTGFLANYAASEDLTVFGGYSFGWDSGFVDNGDHFLGGFTLGLSDDASFTYATTIGRFGTNSQVTTPAGVTIGGLTEKGYMHSMVLDVDLSEGLKWVSQWDYIDTEINNTNLNFRQGFALVNYLMYDINDCTAVGARLEYFHRDLEPVIDGDTNADVYDLTFGINHRLNSNLIVRPEIRTDWDKNGDFGVNENNRASQTTLGVDAILTF